MSSEPEPSRVCPDCGAANTAAARFCEQCGQRLPAPPVSAATAPPPLDAATRPLGPPRAASGTTAGPPPWLAGAPVTTLPEPESAPGRKHGLAGCLFGCLALLVIVALSGALLLLFIARPFVQNRARDELNRLAATEVVRLGPISVPSGRLVVTDAEINAQLAAHASDFAPLSEPTVTISPAGIQVVFKLAGTESTYTGSLAVIDGHLAVLNPSVSGPAGQMLRASDVSRIVELQLATLLANSHLVPTSIQLGNGAMTIVTAPA